MAVLMLIEQYNLSLNQSILDFFVEFPEYGKQITLRHLLTHTSGILDYEDLIPPGTRLPLGDKEVLTLLREQKRTYFPAGQHFRYSNSGYALLALTVEIISGQTFAHFLKKNVFIPLKMNDSLAYEAGISSVRNRAYGYTESDEGFVPTDQSLTSSVLGDGGIYSSISDLVKWDQALYTDCLISPDLLNLSFEAAVQSDKPATGYGFGWYVAKYRGTKEVWHSGNTIGFTTRIARFPLKGFTVILLTNRNEAQIEFLPHQIFDYYTDRGGL
jgi:CubicO group peptidase (beta-lactamase class C family)